MELIDKSALVAEIERLREVQPFGAFQPKEQNKTDWLAGKLFTITILETFINTLEVKDPYEKYIQYASIEDGIKAHAETYSFNIESELFNQLTKEQQKLWRKEIEQACISGGNVGVELARDIRYKENVEMKEVDLEKELNIYLEKVKETDEDIDFVDFARHFFELGIKTKKGE